MKSIGALARVLLQTRGPLQRQFSNHTRDKYQKTRVLQQRRRRIYSPYFRCCCASAPYHNKTKRALHHSFKAKYDKNMDCSLSRPVFHQSDEEFDDEEMISHLEEGDSRTMNTQYLSLIVQLDNLSISESAPNNIASESTSIPVSQIQEDISNFSAATLRSSDTSDEEMADIEDTLKRIHIEDY